MKLIFRFRLFILLACAVMCGCTTILTKVAPPVETILKGEKKMGKPVLDHFALRSKGPGYYLTKKSFCEEVQELKKKSKKYVRGRPFGIIELAFFGLGVFDLARARAYSDESETIQYLKDEATGRILSCGEREPVPHAKIIAISSDQMTFYHTTTDENGFVSFENILEQAAGDFYINIFYQKDASVRYLTTLMVH